MAILSALAKMNNVDSYAEAFEARDITSPEMQSAINIWFALYYDKTGGGKIDSSQRVPYVIVDGLYKATFGEYEYSLDNPRGNIPAENTLEMLDKIRSCAFSQLAIGGEIFIKPYIKNGKFIFFVINRANMTVLGRDIDGKINDLITADKTVKAKGNGTEYYTLLERRKLDNVGVLTIHNKLFRSQNRDRLGTNVPLDMLPEYADLPPELVMLGAFDNLGLVHVKMPMVNCVDGTLDGVSVYAAAVSEIIKLYGHESRTQAEYDLTEPHLVVSTDIQQKDENGRLIDIPKYITPLIDGSVENTGLNIWNPKPNQTELEARDDQIKREIENIINLRRGFLAKAGTQELTATEIISTSSKMAHLISDLQNTWETVLPETLKLCALLAKIYKIPGWVDGEYNVSVNWGNGILYDEEKEFTRLNLMTAQNNLKPEYLLGWYFNMPTKTDKELEAIRKKYMPDITEPESETDNGEF